MGNELSAEERSPTSNSNQPSRFSAASISHDIQARTREVAEKLKLTKARSEESSSSSAAAIATGQRTGKKLGVGVPRSAPTINNKQQNSSSTTEGRSTIQGVRIENDPLEREIYVKCPGCSRKVFDSGLENEIECDFCNLVFVSGKHYSQQQIYQMREQSLQRLEERDDEEDDDEEEYDDEEKEDGEESEEVESSTVNAPSAKKALVTPQGESDAKHHESKKSIKEKTVIEEMKSPSKIIERKSSSSSASKSPMQESPHQQQKKKQIHTASAAAVHRSHQNQSPNPTESSSTYVNELEDVVLFCNSDSIIDDFMHPSTKNANLSLIQEKILKPFFQLSTRILEKASYFKIGDIEFYVAACEPYEFGKVASKTTIRCTQAVSKSVVLERINLVPLRRLDNSRTAIYETAIKPFLEENPDYYVHKNQILEFEDYEFYVKYARPFFGRIDLETTDIKIDSSTPKPVQVLRIAPIWNTDQQYEQANSRKQETFDQIKKNYLHPFFFCGFMCYVERGETIKIDDQEFFLNDCRPKYGIVDKQTIIELEVGFTQEVFKKKQVLADQRFAEKIQSRDTTGNGSQPISANSIRQRVASANLHQRPETAQEIEEFLRYAAATGTDMLDLLDGNSSAAQGSHGATSEEEQRRSHPRRQAHSTSDRTNVDEYQLLLMLQQQAQIQQRLLLHGRSVQQQSLVTPKAIVDALPEHPITSEFLQRHAQSEGNDDKEVEDCVDSSRKCMVCIMDYEVGESVRTMPCLHYFHTECIDKWLLQRACTCPICKFDIRKNYNMSAPSGGHHLEKSHSNQY